ncbi:MAG: GNAT family N-acetyltransferase [Waterburya sp.]
MLVSDRLESDLVILRRYSLADTSELFTAISDSIERVYPWLPWCHPGYTFAETNAWLKTRPQCWHEGKEYGFSIRDRDNRIIGGCGIGIKSASWSGNLGYWLRTGYTGKGYATEATKLLAKFGIQQLQLKRIEIVASVHNLPSQKVAVRAGAYREGISRNRLLLHNKLHDAVIYSFIPQDFAV